jgi:hypothetical protein
MTSTNKPTNDEYRTHSSKVSPHHTPQTYVKCTQQASHYEYCFLTLSLLMLHIYIYVVCLKRSVNGTRKQTKQNIQIN